MGHKHRYKLISWFIVDGRTYYRFECQVCFVKYLIPKMWLANRLREGVW